MRKYLTPIFIFTLFLNINISFAKDNIETFHHTKEALRQAEMAAFLKHIFDDNAQYVEETSHEDFKSFAEQQLPRATIVSCSDSRIQSNAYHKSPVNDIFYIRNIGNQIINTEGSVEYGVNHLKTPVLMIIGHSSCGAIRAALGDYSKESSPIQDELDHLHLTKGTEINAAVLENVHNQVRYALQKFKDKVAQKELLVIGTVYDFRDDYEHGHGRLILINLNGEQDPEKIKQNDMIKDIKEIAIGEKKAVNIEKKAVGAGKKAVDRLN